MWAAFLGASWTWVIGMYLPVLLVRDFSIWGWIIFALPNVIGAAAMGAVVLTGDRSQKMLAQHAPMATAFSIVTIAFHLFFVGWQMVRLFGERYTMALFILAAAMFLIGGARRDLWLAVVALFISLVCMAVVTTQPLEHGRWWFQDDPKPQLLALTPVCVFGFLLCPYLDLTFHRARQAMEPRAGIRAFQLGFGVFFLLMILFTLLYADFLAWNRPRPGVNTRLVGWMVYLHLMVQIAFTVSVHVRAVLAGANRVRFSRIALVLAALVAIGLAAFAQRRWLYHQYLFQMDAGEVIYRCFMGFYGLVFPAYVWLCMIPKGKAAAPDRGLWLRFIAAVVLALPFFWMGFILQQYWWLLAGLAIVLVMRWTVRRVDPAPAAA